MPPARCAVLALSLGEQMGAAVMPAEWAPLLRAINARHGTSFRLLRRYRGGEQGAYALADETGQRFVLKRNVRLDWAEAASDATDALRAAGYPAPQYLYMGSVAPGSYVILTALPGTPRDTITLDQLPRLLELNARQRGRASADGADWPQRMVSSVLEGCDGFCVVESLLTYSSETARLLVALQALVGAHGGELPVARDIVHMDFSPTNLLQVRGAISGVIDWEGTCAGDAAFDLATLLFYRYDDLDLRAALWQIFREQCASGAQVVYLMHLILRQVDWSIRHHPPETVARYLRRADDILRDVGA